MKSDYSMMIIIVMLINDNSSRSGTSPADQVPMYVIKTVDYSVNNI